MKGILILLVALLCGMFASAQDSQDASAILTGKYYNTRELLIRFSILQRDYEQALVLALGTKVRYDFIPVLYTIGQSALVEGRYNTAAKAFSKVVGKGEVNNNFYLLALKDNAHALFLKFSSENFHSQLEMNQMEKVFLNAIAELGNNRESYDVIADDTLFELAELCERKLNQSQTALQSYTDLLMRYPVSIHTNDVRETIRSLRERKSE